MGLNMSCLCLAFRRLLVHEGGQDLVEYALIVALIALAATAGMNVLATDLSNAFSNVGATLTSYIP
jgi:pilus assembly protein Flp/PilA